jgi:TRAP-type uncharacterized transport system fused permease subunit
VASSFRAPAHAARLRGAREALVTAARDVVPLIAAAACVGIVIGVVTLTGVGTRLPATILPLAEHNLLLALVVIMISSLVLGMGLPSAVTYLLLATLIGPVLGQLGVVPLAAHLFIFYFGMMAMVTPPVALAATPRRRLPGADIMKTGLAAFRFALVGFTLPYIFVFRPELLLLSRRARRPLDVVLAIAVAVLGIAAFAAALAGYLFAHVPAGQRVRAVRRRRPAARAGPDGHGMGFPVHVLDTSGLVVAAVAAVANWRRAR